MRFTVDPSLMEEAVFLALKRRGDMDPVTQHYHRNREILYEDANQDLRAERFAKLNEAYFTSLDIAGPVRRMLDERPVIGAQTGTFLLHRVFLAKEEGAELFGQKMRCGAQRGFNALLRVRTETMLNPPQLERLCRHEFMHLADMLDPEFEYEPDGVFAGTTAAQQSLARDRFVTLWDLRIDARLSAAGQLGEHSRDHHALNFKRLFGAGGGWDELFAGLFDRGLLAELRYRELLACANDPALLPRLASLHAPSSGAVLGSQPCALCGFPSRVWSTSIEQMPPALRAELKFRVPGWTHEKKICMQCEELVRAGLKHKQRVRTFPQRSLEEVES